VVGVCHRHVADAAETRPAEADEPAGPAVEAQAAVDGGVHDAVEHHLCRRVGSLVVVREGVHGSHLGSRRHYSGNLGRGGSPFRFEALLEAPVESCPGLRAQVGRRRLELGGHRRLGQLVRRVARAVAGE